jgi:hypothetical protein
MYSILRERGVLFVWKHEGASREVREDVVGELLVVRLGSGELGVREVGDDGLLSDCTHVVEFFVSSAHFRFDVNQSDLHLRS